MSALELQVYEIFKTRFTEAEASKVIEYFEAKAEDKIVQKQDVFLTKDDKVDLIEKMNKDKIDLIKWMFGFWVTLVLLFVGNWFLHK